ncbi:putative uncharacterized protein [Prevotella sp. CAG:1124]|nr:putative uncharacterized protein [Prevotella sp. CAG:1124]
MTVYFVPVFLEVSHGVTHRVGVFAGKDGTVIVGLLRYRKEPFPACVLGAFHVVVLHSGIEILFLYARIEAAYHVNGGRVFAVRALSAFVMYKTCRVIFLHPGSRCREVGAPSRLVPERPEHYAGMVTVADYHALRPVHEGGSPCRVARKLAAQTVFLDVCLVHYVYSVLVAQFIPARVVGIMACAHGVDVALLQQSYLLLHAFHGHHLARYGVHLVTVHSAEAGRHAVDEEAAVLYFKAAESDFCLHLLYLVALIVDQGQLQCVEVRRLCRPFQRVLNRSFEPSVGGVTTLRVACVHDFALVVEVQHGDGILFQNAVEHGFAVGVVQLCLYVITLAALSFDNRQFGMDYESCVAIVVVKQRAHAEVTNADWRRGVKIYAAVYSGEAPHVLVFKVTAVGILQNFQCYEVLAAVEVGRQAELRRLHTSL